MGILSKEDILKARDEYYEYEEIPEWGGKVKICAMSLRDRLEFEKMQASIDKKDGTDIDVILFVLSKSLKDDEGNQLFTVKEAEGLLDKSTKAVYHVFKRCTDVNKTAIDDEELSEKN